MGNLRTDIERAQVVQKGTQNTEWGGEKDKDTEREKRGECKVTGE